MSVESFRSRPDIIEVVFDKYKDDRTYGRAFSVYHSLALRFKEEGRNGLRRTKFEPGADWELNYGAIVFGVAMRAIEVALKEGICDTSEILSHYNEGVTGTTINQIPYAQTEPELIPEPQLAEMKRYSLRDRTHAIFFIDDDAHKTLPLSVRALIARTNTFAAIKNKVIPVYGPLAALLEPSSAPKTSKSLSLVQTAEIASTMQIPGMKQEDEEKDPVIKNFKRMWREAEEKEKKQK